MKHLILVLLLPFTLALTAQSDTVYTQVDEPPAYPGGDDAFYTYVADQLTLDLNAFDKRQIAEKGVYRILPAFIIDETGEVDSVWLDDRSTDFLLSTKLERILYEMPKWTPGKKEGEAVSTKVYVWLDMNVYSDVVAIQYHPIFPDSEMLAYQKTQKGINLWAVAAVIATIGLFALLISL